MLVGFVGRATVTMASANSVMNFPIGLRYHRLGRTIFEVLSQRLETGPSTSMRSELAFDDPSLRCSFRGTSQKAADHGEKSAL